MQKASDAASGRTAVDAVCAAASSVGAAVAGLTLPAVATYPHRRHRRPPHHSCLESLRVPCAHVAVHTAMHQPVHSSVRRDLVLTYWYRPIVSFISPDENS